MITIIVFLWHWCSSFLALKKVNFMWLTSFLLETGEFAIHDLHDDSNNTLNRYPFTLVQMMSHWRGRLLIPLRFFH